MRSEFRSSRRPGLRSAIGRPPKDGSAKEEIRLGEFATGRIRQGGPAGMAVFFSLLFCMNAMARPTTRGEAVPSDDNLVLSSPGISGPIPYEKFGHFDNVGTAAYHYVI